MADRSRMSAGQPLAHFDVGAGSGGAAMRRGVPAIRVGGRLVTTALDCLLVLGAPIRTRPTARSGIATGR